MSGNNSNQRYLSRLIRKMTDTCHPPFFLPGLSSQHPRRVLWRTCSRCPTMTNSTYIFHIYLFECCLCQHALEFYSLPPSKSLSLSHHMTFFIDSTVFGLSFIVPFVQSTQRKVQWFFCCCSYAPAHTSKRRLFLSVSFFLKRMAFGEPFTKVPSFS